MDYATLQDLIDRFGEEELIQLTDRTNMPQSTIDETVTAQALSDAFAQIDGYLVATYPLPLASVPQRLVKVASDIARYYLHGKAADDSVRKAYDDAVGWLVQVSKGIVKLEVANAPAPSSGGVQSSIPASSFDPSVMGDF